MSKWIFLLLSPAFSNALERKKEKTNKQKRDRRQEKQGNAFNLLLDKSERAQKQEGVPHY